MEQKKVVYRFQQTDNVHEIFIFDEIRKIGPFNWDTWQYDDSETSAKHFKELLDAIPETDEIKILSLIHICREEKGADKCQKDRDQQLGKANWLR